MGSANDGHEETKGIGGDSQAEPETGRAREWLPEGFEPVGRPPEPPERSQWRADGIEPGSGPTGEGVGEERPTGAPHAGLDPLTPDAPPHGSASDSSLELRARLEAVERTLAGAKAQTDDLASRVGRLERELGAVGRRAKMGDALAHALSEYGHPDASKLPADLAGTDRLNQATFEDLRGLGLSITQAARVIATRDARRGFRAPEDLEEIPGLSDEQIEELKRLIEG